MAAIMIQQADFCPDEPLYLLLWDDSENHRLADPEESLYQAFVCPEDHAECTREVYEIAEEITDKVLRKALGDSMELSPGRWDYGLEEQRDALVSALNNWKADSNTRHIYVSPYDDESWYEHCFDLSEDDIPVYRGLEVLEKVYREEAREEAAEGGYAGRVLISMDRKRYYEIYDSLVKRVRAQEITEETVTQTAKELHEMFVREVAKRRRTE